MVLPGGFSPILTSPASSLLSGCAICVSIELAMMGFGVGMRNVDVIPRSSLLLLVVVLSRTNNPNLQELANSRAKSEGAIRIGTQYKGKLLPPRILLFLSTSTTIQLNSTQTINSNYQLKQNKNQSTFIQYQKSCLTKTRPLFSPTSTLLLVPFNLLLVA
jgi:hypothetical protein